MSLAERLVNELMLVSVLVAGQGADALASALCEAGAAAESLHGVPGQNFDLAILLTQASAAWSAETRALVSELAQVSDRLLLATLPLGQVAGGAAPGLPELPAWFELFAELGYQPVVEFDASFVSPGAFLVDRAATAAEGELAAFTDRLQLGAEAAAVQREAVQEAERNVRSELQVARATLDARDEELAKLRRSIDAARAELSEMSSRAVQLAEAAQSAQASLQEAENRNAGWDGLRSWIRLEVAGAGRNDLAILVRDLPALNDLRAPELPAFVLTPPKLRFPALRRPLLLLRAMRAQEPILLGEAALIRACPLFDAAWYVAANMDVFAAAPLDPVFHYMLVGGPRGLDPGPWFDTAAYLREHPEAAGNPLLHAIRTGAVEKNAT